MIDKFTWKGKSGAWVHGPFSNFHISHFTAPWWGDPQSHELVWPSAEHYYQAAKLTSVADVAKILESDSPGRSKKLGRSLPNRSDWQACSIRAMRDTLTLKFAIDGENGDALAYALLTTGDRMLVEGNTWGDQFFGMVKNEQGTYQGQNWLGLLLMARRAELRAELAGQTQMF